MQGKDPTPPPAPEDDRTTLDADEAPAPLREDGSLGSGDRLGPYRLVRPLGEGGMGMVYLAEQLEPLRRQVALKLIRQQVMGGLAEAYFEVERQALAEMDHPAIAKVYDAGRTADGYPYFAMEWIDGAPLDAWLANARPDRRTCLKLMIELARGVHHAHQRGIVHRDLKPSNVLVAEVDGAPHPKIIDFGVAIGVARPGMPMGPPSYDRAGTGPYMSPEQLEGNFGLDTRSDVYSLGVILLVLLLPAGGLAALGDPPPMRGDLHRVVLHSLRGPRGPLTDVLEPIPRELRWVLARALEPDRERRYASAQALAEELERFLTGYALDAVPATRGYRLRKFARRNAGALAAGAAVAVALLVGLAAALYGLQRAEREAEKSRTLAGFLGDVLSGVDPDRARDLDKSLLRLVLDEAAQRADRELASQPDVLVDVKGVIGNSYSSVSDYPKAQEHLRAAYELSRDRSGADSPTTLQLAAQYADVQTTAGAAEAGEKLARETVERARHVLGAEHRTTREAELALGWSVRELGRYVEAEQLLAPVVRALQADADGTNPDPLDGGYLYAIALSDLERFDDGERELRRLIADSTRVRGADHPKTLRLRNSLAVLFLQAKRYPDAEVVLKELIPAAERTFGPDHSATLGSVSNLGGALRQQGKLEESGPHYRRAVEQLTAKLGAKHPRAVMARHNFGNYLLDAGEHERSLATQREALDYANEAFSSEHPVKAEILEGWGKAATALERWDEAEAKLRESLAMKQRIYGDKHRTLDNVNASLAAFYAKSGRPPPAGTP